MLVFGDVRKVDPLFGLVLKIGIGRSTHSLGLFLGEKVLSFPPNFRLLRLPFLLMFEDQRLRTRIVDMRVHVLEERLVQGYELDMERADTQSMDHTVPMVRIIYLDKPDLVIERIVRAMPRVKHDRLIPAGRIFVEIMRERLSAADAEALFRTLDRDRSFLAGRVGHRFVVP